MNKPRRPWAKLGLEMLAIVFSVLLALFLDDWRESRAERQVAEAMELSLRVELERNQRLLEGRLSVHEALSGALEEEVVHRIGEDEDLTRLADVGTIPSPAELGLTEGLGVEISFATSAWEAARVSVGFQHIPLDRLFLLSAAYTGQNDLGRLSNRVVDAYDRYVRAVIEEESTGYALLSMESAVAALVSGEVELCTIYRNLAGQLNDETPADIGRCGSGHITIR